MVQVGNDTTQVGDVAVADTVVEVNSVACIHSSLHQALGVGEFTFEDNTGGNALALVVYSGDSVLRGIVPNLITVNAGPVLVVVIGSGFVPVVDYGVIKGGVCTVVADSRQGEEIFACQVCDR